MGCCSSKPAARAPIAAPATASPPPPQPSPAAEEVPVVIPPEPLAYYEDTRDQYRLKDITFFGSHRRILLQSANGPCPLLALCNVLLLRNQLRISPDARYTSFPELVQEVGNRLFDMNERATSGAIERVNSGSANVRANANACLEILPKLNGGLDVNCKFGGPSQFEYTQELGVFDLLDIGLYHGWVVGQQDQRAHDAIAHLSYNQIVEKLIAFQETQPEDAGEEAEHGRLIAEFMDRTASQLSEEGLVALHDEVREKELVVFYRNGHFSTMVKNEGQLYLLCTDMGFAGSHVVWERLDEVNGNTTHCDASFQTSTAATGEAEALAAAMAAQEQMLAADFGTGMTGGVGNEDTELLLAIQMSQQEAAQAGGAPAPGGGASDVDQDALLAMRLMQEDLEAQQQGQGVPVR